ncbi:MAG: hypothetical protein KAI59_06625 [Planctomycetes bacterium]|nr:hypothetical protein [Planctomycetota bacterium]MCK5473691.1 hypothetical protein [Planctomycetota bacterium]
MSFRILMFITIVLWLAGNLLGGEPIWQKEIVCDPNTGCYPCAVAADVFSNKLVIYGTRMKSIIDGGDFMFWEINPDGSILQEIRIGSVPGKPTTLPLSKVSDMIIKSDNNIIALGRFDSNTPSSSLLTINQTTGSSSKPTKVSTKSQKKYNNIIITKLLSSNNSIVLAGHQGTDGLLIKLDNNGNEKWNVPFDLGKTEIFTDAAVKSNVIYVTGITVNIREANKMGFGSETKNFLLIYDVDGQLLKQDYFKGVCSTKLPQVTQLENGNVLVAYDKSEDITATDLNVRAYSPDLTLLWETQVVEAEGSGPPGYFKIIAVSGDRFFIGAVFNGGELVIVECSSNGQVIERWSLGKIVGPYGELHIEALGGKVYAVFGTPSYGNFQNVKIMALAFPIK